MAAQCIGLCMAPRTALWTPLATFSTRVPARGVPAAPLAPRVRPGAALRTPVPTSRPRLHLLRVRSAIDDAGQSNSTPSASAEVLTKEEVSEAKGAAAPSSTQGLPAYKHILVPVMDRNPHLNEATRGALEFGTALAKANSSEITVVVIDEDEKEDSKDHQQRLDSIRFYLNQGGFDDYKLLERFGGGKMPAAVVGEVADDLELDLVVLSMEAVHHKHIDCNLLAEFTPCPVMLLPL